MKKNRHELILSFIQNNNVSTQDEIIKMLSEHGYNVTQATISRDIKELKLIKEHYGKNEVKYAVSTKKDNNDKYKIFEQLLPQDLLKFGLIPEFVGRLPIIATLQELDKDALVEIVTKPKNALVKQYKKLLELDGVELEFEKEALTAIVEKAIERNTGARGLRSIIEDIMRDIMFDIPSNMRIEKCIITKDTVEKKAPPILELCKESEVDNKRGIVKKRKPKAANNTETA